MEAIWTTVTQALQIEDIPLFHLVVEGVLVLVLLWLVFAQSKPSKPQHERLTPKEEQKLLDEWIPEPLVDASKTREMSSHPVAQSSIGRAVEIDGKTMINMASFNLLGFSGDKQLEEEAVRSIRKYGVGSCGPRGFYGTIDCHLDLEKEIEQFMGCEECILYSYGFSTIASAIPAYSKRGDVIFCDEAVILAIQKGLVASRSRIELFKHNDMADLKRLLDKQAELDAKDKQKARATRRFIVTEGIFLNTGNICPLPELVDLKYKYQCRLIIDESLSFGVLGANGRGVTEHFNVKIDDVDVIAVSMGSALGSVGGFCCGRSFVIDHQRLSGQGYCYSASLPPFLAVSAIHSVRRIGEDEGKSKRNSLLKNIKTLRAAVGKSLGNQFLLSGNELSPVQHLVSKQATTEETEKLLDDITEKCRLDSQVVITRAKYAPEEEMNQKRPSIRLVLSSDHTAQDIEATVNAIATAVKSSS